MKNLNIYLGISIMIIFILILNLFINQPVCGRMHFDNADRTQNVIVSAEIAQKIVEI